MLGGATDDNLTGGNKSDLLVGNAGNDSLNGGDGDDILIGGQGQDTLKGDAGNDILIGGADVDILDGGTGNDQLKGGDGVDVYQFTGTYGTDVIADSDGQGIILIGGDANTGGTQLNGGKQLGDNRVYQSTDKQYTYAYITGNAVDGGDLVITKTNDSNSIIIKNHKVGSSTGNLGISMEAATAPTDPTTTRDIKGDLKPQDFSLTEAGIQTELDDLGNVIVTSAAEPDRDDYLNDSMGNDHITSGGGKDIINAFRGGDGNEILYCGAGNDALFNDAQNDDNWRLTA